MGDGWDFGVNRDTQGEKIFVRKQIKVAIIGLGKMGRIRATELEHQRDAVLWCGCDPDSMRYSDFPGLRCFPDWREALAEDIDAVFVATPNRVAPKAVCEALDAGKHVFCEKPPGCAVSDIEAIREAERRNPGLALQFGFNHRYHGSVQDAYRIVSSGVLGRILWMRGVYGKAGGAGFEHSWRNDKAQAGAGILLDQGIHMLDLFRFFGGEFTEVKSMAGTLCWPVEVEDNVFALLRGASGCMAMLHSSSVMWRHRFQLEIMGMEGYVRLDGILSASGAYAPEALVLGRRTADGTDRTDRSDRSDETITTYDADCSWRLEIEDFLGHVRNGAPVVSGSSEDALQAMRLVQAIYENDRVFMNGQSRPMEGGVL